MAVNYNINPYQVGAVVFDQKPYLAFYERQKAREDAKSDALESYFKDLNKNVTSTGMRSQDVPTLLQKNKDWQQHYIQNKAAILNPKLDNGAAYSKYMNGYQDQLAVTNESKEAQKDDEQLAKLKFNKDFNYVFDDPDIMKNMALANLPIGDPNRKRFDITTAMLPPKPIGTKEREEFSKYVIGEIKPDKIPGNPMNVGNFQTQTPIMHQYSDQNKMIFGQKASDIYDTDKSWRVEANKMFKELQHDPIQYQQLNDVYKRYYGNEIDSPKEAFMAKTILDHDIKSIEYEKGDDKLGLATATAALRHKYAEDEIRLRESIKNKGESEQNDKIDELYSNVIKDALKNKVKYEPAVGKPFDQYQINATPGMKKLFGIPDGKGHMMYPDDFRLSPDKTKVTPIYFEHSYDDKNNRTEEIVKDKNNRAKVLMDISKPILESEFKERWKKDIMGAEAYGKSLKDNKQASPESRKYNIDGKTYTHEQLKKMYSEDKIKQYLDAGIIK